MIRYIATRLLLMLPTLLGVLVATFILIQFVPGGPVEQALAQLRQHQQQSGHGGELDATQVAAIKKLYGFDKPPLERFWLMLSSFARFDFGTSFQNNRDVWQLIKEKLPVSISLGVWTFLAAYLLSIPLGIAKAVREGSRFDALSSIAVLVGFAMPGFVLGVVLIVLFCGGTFLEWFPLRGLTSDNWAELSWPARIADYLWHLTLPLVCLTIGSFATLTMLTKNTFLEEIRKQYVLVARAKGLPERKVLYKHVFRNALMPIVTGLPAALVAAFFGGALLIETLFSLDGLGLLSYESIIRRDYPVVLGSLYLFTLIGLGIKLVADLLYVLVDPRVQFGAGGAMTSLAARAGSASPRNRARLSLAANRRRDAAGEPLRAAALERAAAARPLPGPPLRADRLEPARDDLRRRLRDRDRLARSADRAPLPGAGQLGRPCAQSLFGLDDQLHDQEGAPGTAFGRELARHRRPRPRRPRAAALRLRHRHAVRLRPDRRDDRPRRPRRRGAGLLRRLDRPRQCSA